MFSRRRVAFIEKQGLFSGAAEVDEIYVGGRRRNMSNAKRGALTQPGPVGKTALVGAKERTTRKVAAPVVQHTDALTLPGCVAEHADLGAEVSTDDATAYQSLPFDHATLKHSLSEYVRGDICTNGVESPWSMLKRAHKGRFPRLSPKHLDAYVQEFSGRRSLRDLCTLDQLAALVIGMEGSCGSDARTSPRRWACP